ncbi:SDR family oxidoreductase [Actinacidiphila oryziradicis]|uniref:NAD-dependent epimerase/dehydratase family protein n=1 Tax=Actinacidiphila oryziradicis TaxID=2571141 RepID=A0A4V5MZ12_9ACTN|nr:NAD(P)H-binding protein [Actinacidiphila oryziradicis]TKA06399.1 NAD-dependent epimerase/dehydratase family protein [Actinacidiphila oryziradicis]
MKILVTGATGTVGGHVARQLSGSGHQLVALVRDPSKADLPADITIVEGDLTDPSAVRRALDGTDRAFLNMADDNGAVFAEAAAKAGLGHAVLLSSFTSVTELPFGPANIITARHQAGEQALTKAGVPSTFLRSAGFDYNILMWVAGAADGVVRAPNADVKLPVVDPADIAAAAVAVLTAADPKPGAYSITGPQSLSVRDQIAVINKTLDRSYTVQEISQAEAATAAFPQGTPDFVTTSVLETMGPGAAVLVPSDDVQALTGKAARSFRAWVVDNAKAIA